MFKGILVRIVTSKQKPGPSPPRANPQTNGKHSNRRGNLSAALSGLATMAKTTEEDTYKFTDSFSTQPWVNKSLIITRA